VSALWRSDWFRFVDAYSTSFGPAEVAVMPHGISITVPRSDEKRYSEENPRVKCNICGYVLCVDDIFVKRGDDFECSHERDLNVFNELKGVLVMVFIRDCRPPC